MMKLNGRMLMLSIPFLAGFLLFYILPFFYSVYYSVIESAFVHRFVGLSNFREVLSNKYYRLALKNTFMFTLIGVPLLVFLALLLSLALYSIKGRIGLLRALFILPMLLPTASVIPIFRYLFVNQNSGAYLAASALGLSSEQIIALPIYLLYLWKNVGFHIILLTTALEMVPHDLYEAAALDGAGGMRRLRSITLPLIMPTVFFVIVLSIIQSLRIFKEAYLLYGAYPDPSIYLVQHYMNNHFYKLNYQYLTAGAILFAGIVYLLVAFGYRFERKLDVSL